MQKSPTTPKITQPAPVEQQSPIVAVPQVIFANWREALHQSNLPRHLQGTYQQAIGRFLEFCTLASQSVTRQSASNFLSDAYRRHLAPANGQWEQALDWFFVNGEQRSALQPEGVPSVGQADTGKTPWERRMIE